MKRRVKQPPKERFEEKEKFDITRNTTPREELHFQFDEETPPPTGRHNAFSEGSV